MNAITAIFGIFIVVLSNAYGIESYLSDTECIVYSSSKQDIPQAPRVAPNGKNLLYEWYSNKKCEIWICDIDGKNGVSLTANLQKSGKIDTKVENAFWHPSGRFIAFNGAPQGMRRTGCVYISQINDQSIDQIIVLEKGARPQFSKPNGNVVFFEHTEGIAGNGKDGGIYNTLYYRVLGQNPLQPVDNTSIPLRGPIQLISKSTELSHPSLAPNGTTILFAARASSNVLNNFNTTDINRQRAVELWRKLVAAKTPIQKIKNESGSIGDDYANFINDSLVAPGFMDDINAFNKHVDSIGAQATIIPGFTKRDFVNCWLLGLLGKLQAGDEKEIQSLLYPKIWMTDVFGAAIVPLVDDSAGVPLPQKWATVSQTGRFSVFEAGEYRNRHLYLVNMHSRKVVRLTEQGKYNSSPEISPDEQWIYFESDRNGSKCIWRARLNHDAIQSSVQRYE